MIYIVIQCMGCRGVGEEEKIYDVYFKLKKDVFDQESGEAEKNEEIIRGAVAWGLGSEGAAPGMMKQVF